jgi:hypothetical protein
MERGLFAGQRVNFGMYAGVIDRRFLFGAPILIG